MLKENIIASLLAISFSIIEIKECAGTFERFLREEEFDVTLYTPITDLVDRITIALVTEESGDFSTIDYSDRESRDVFNSTDRLASLLLQVVKMRESYLRQVTGLLDRSYTFLVCE